MLARDDFKTFGDVFDRFTVNCLIKLIQQHHFDSGTLSPVSVGKESNVFSALKGRERVIVKIHRLEVSDFNNIYRYIASDPRFANLRKQKRDIIFAWAQREYRNLMVAREANVNAPLPVAVLKNVLVMGFIGNKQPAPKLKDAVPENPDAFFKEVAENMRKLYRKGFIHADLSAFNILNHNEKPCFIDFSHATPLKNPNAKEFLERDIRNICNFFRKIGVKAEEEKLMKLVTKK